MAITALSEEQRQAAQEKAQRSRSSSKNVDELISEAGSGVGLTHMPKVRSRLLEMPETSRQTYLRAMRGKSPAAGIRAHCSMCANWVRAEVTRCSDPACPLWPYRPYQ